TGIALALLTIHAECEQVLCSGAFRGRRQTYASFAHRAPRARRLTRDEALAELTRRYFRSHGPATARDFAWWSGLTAADAKRGLEIIRATSRTIDSLRYWSTTGAGRGRTSPHQAPGVLLLPPYDEYVVAYRDREAVPHGVFSVNFGAVVIDGQIAGTWRPAS